MFRFAVPCALLVGLACSSSRTATKPPAPSPAPAPAPSTTTATGGAATQPGAPTGGRAGAPGAGGAQPGGGRPTMTPEVRAARRDSLTQARAQVVQQLMAKIAGHENEPAGQVFKNVLILKDVPAGQFLTAMDQNFGRSLSMGCTSCHVVDQWDLDDKQAKKTARIMIQVVNAINTEQLTKLPPNRNGQTPRIGCVTCHRGNGNPGQALVP